MSSISEPTKAVNIFFSYAHQDKALRDKLVKHLSLLQRQGLITNWHDHEISAGTEWASAVDSNLDNAHLILLLISPDYMNSEYCYSVEMKRAFQET